MSKATCPECGKVVKPTELNRFPAHRVPKGSPAAALRTGRCLDSGARVLRKHLVHPCQVCASLPEAPEDVLIHSAPGTEYRPREPRPVSPRSGPRSPLCDTHQTAKERAQRAARNAYARERGRGVSEDDRNELWEAQGCACVCGRTLHTATKAPTLDHSHRRARTHEHPENQACRRCVRGVLCDTCNRVLVGRYSPAQLRAVALYMENPTAARLGWWTDTEESNTWLESLEHSGA